MTESLTPDERELGVEELQDLVLHERTKRKRMQATYFFVTVSARHPPCVAEHVGDGEQRGGGPPNADNRAPG